MTKRKRRTERELNQAQINKLREKIASMQEKLAVTKAELNACMKLEHEFAAQELTAMLDKHGVSIEEALTIIKQKFDK